MADNTSGEVLALDELLESSLESVDAAETSVLKVAEEAGFDEESLHKIGMAVREAMVNAVVHGNRYSARKRVHLQVSRAADHLSIVIRDEGEGFEFENLPDPLSEENLLRQSGRGLLLMQAFVDKLDVRRRTSGGTEVRMIKYLASD
ncbi:MAG TPA: ATP-binding protein [Bryobacteraceae bacterium]|jgi:serine/threonine-protein kinase RsbW|nr:ATP-binding protein [Bryobacteraceae bacterium]